MRIEAYTQVQQLYQSQKVSRTQKTQNTAHTDRLQISSQGKDFRPLRQQWQPHLISGKS